MLNLSFVRMSRFIISIPSILLIFVTGVGSESDVDRLRVASIFIYSSFNFRFPVNEVDFSAIALSWFMAISLLFRLP